MADALKVDPAARELCARLVDAMKDMVPYREQPWARMALAVAARSIRRGRHLTSREQLENLAKSVEEDGDEESARLAALIRGEMQEPGHG